MQEITDDILARLKQVRVLLLDVDGVLTDGKIIYTDAGQEVKYFHVKDGLGLRLSMEAGIRVGIITGRRSQALLHRCKNLGIDLVFDGIHDKAVAFETIIERLVVDPSAVCFVGDDLPDLPVMRRVGLAVAVANACEEVKETAHMITEACGGEGALRELCEAILSAQGLWKGVIARFYSK